MKRGPLTPPPGKGWLGRIPPAALDRPLDDLGLSTRPRRCLHDLPSIAELLARRESDLMTLRGFGESCLVEVRRQVALFMLHQVQPQDEGATLDPDTALPVLEQAWSGPAQPRPLADLLQECFDLLARTGLPAKGASPQRTPATAVNRTPIKDASLTEVVEHLFAGIPERDRSVVLLRFGSTDTEPLAFAEIGRQVGVTRERVRQIYGATMDRLSQPPQAQRRREVVRLLQDRFKTGGNLLREADASQALATRHAGSETEAMTLARVLLHVTPTFGNVQDSLWCAEPLRAPETRETLVRLRGIVRNAGRWLTRAQVLAELRPHRPSGITEAAAASCLLAHPELFTPDNHRFGLREWESGIPASLDEALRHLLRASPAPKTPAGLAQELENVLPDGAVPPASQIEHLLAANAAFRRSNGNRYTLVE